MHLARILLIACLALPTVARAAVEDGDDWSSFGHVLALVHSFVRLAAQSQDPRAMQEGVEAILDGRDAEVNRAATGLFDEMTADMPAEHRARFGAIARELAMLARRGQARGADALEGQSLERALQARKDLHAIGLRYHDAAQFLDAVRRDDALAAELYVLARGVNLSARDAEGRDALELARANGNRPLAEFLARNLRAGR